MHTGWLGRAGRVAMLAGAFWAGPALSAPAQEAAQPAAAAFDVLQDRPDRLIVQLPNRLIVVAQELHATPVVSAQVWVKTGSIYEQEFVGAGLSHFLEHLLSGGSTRMRTEEQSNAILGRIGAQVNAATSLDTVHYYINTTRPFAGEAVDLLSDWMQNTLITEAEYNRERDVIQKEFAMGEGEPGRIHWKLTQQARYTHHPARHPTIGYLDEYLRVSREQISDFYHRMYAPNNLVFVVVGDIDKRAVVEQIAGLWKDAKPAELPTIDYIAEPVLAEVREVSGVAGVELPQIRLAWPGTRLGAEHDYALDLLAVVLGQGESSRLTRAIRDEQRLVNRIVAYNLSFPWGEGYFGIDFEPAANPAAVRPADAAKLLDDAVVAAERALLEEVAKVRDTGVSAEELARAKRQTLARTMLANQAADDIAGRLAGDLIGMGDPDYLRHYADAIQTVTAEQVQAAAGAVLKPEAYLRVKLMPLREGGTPTLMSRPPESGPVPAEIVEKVVLDNAKLAERIRAAAAGDQAAAVVAEPVQRFTLSNGLRVIVGRSNLVPAVAVQMYSLGGLLADTPGREGVVNAAMTMMMRGTTTRNAQQLAVAVEDLGADLSTEAGNNTHFARAVALKEDFPKIMELLADVWVNPAFPAEEWQRLEPRLLAAIDSQNDNWGAELRNTFRQAYFGDAHPWSQATLGRRAVVEKLTTEDLAQFHREHLGASQAVLVVFGDVDSAQVVDLAEKHFGATLPKTPLAFVEPATPAPPTPRLMQVATNKALAAVQVGFGPGIARSSPDYPALAVLLRVVSSFPSGWLEQELRGRGPGLVYAVSAGQMTGFVPGYLAVMFNTQPGNAVEALSRSMAVVERARSRPVDAETLAAAKARVLMDEFFYKQALADQAAEAALNELYGLPADEAARFVAAVEALTPEQLLEVARAYFRNPVALVLTHEPLPEDALKKAMDAKPLEPLGD